ncbi:MAG TPA: phosphoserine phosphatase SerB [Stellaceae bacterium]|nr:phosphoserine phosphatase SerB [Stellaceae bacterium]
MTILTLIGGDGAAPALSRIAARLAAEFAVEPLWLGAGEACEFSLDLGDRAAVEAQARALIGRAPIDLVLQPRAAERKKRLLVADLESTIIENEMLDELAGFLGLRAKVSAITRRAMNGEIDFLGALEARVALLAGMEERVLEEARARVRLMPGARTLVATMRAAGAVTALVSGGFAVFAEPVAAELGVDHVVANRLEIAGGRVAGRVLPPIVTGEVKRATLFELAARHSIALPQTLAVGDGANDLPMLAAAGLGVAFRAKPAVAAAARARIEHADLTALLYLQGYRRGEFAA